MKIETQVIQNSIFTFTWIDEQNGSLHQHQSNFAVIDYYQRFKPPFLRLENLKEKTAGDLGGLHWPVVRSLVSANRWLRGIKTYRFPWYLTLVSANHASSTHPKRISVKFTTKPRTKQKKLLQRHKINNKAYTPTTNC